MNLQSELKNYTFKNNIRIYSDVMKIGPSNGVTTIFIEIKKKENSENIHLQNTNDFLTQLYLLPSLTKDTILKNNTHFCFVGKNIDPISPECQEDILTIMEIISKEMLEYQKTLLVLDDTSKSFDPLKPQKLQKLNPPFFEVITNGKTKTSENIEDTIKKGESFLEYFNFVLVTFYPNEKDQFEFDFSAFVELSQHSFSSFLFYFSNEKQYESFEEQFLKTNYLKVIFPLRTYLLPLNENDENLKNFLKEKAAINYFRTKA